MNEDQPLRPANMLNIVEINQGKRPYSMDEPRSKGLRAQDVARMMGDGHIVIDTRSPADFGAGHLPGTYNIQLSSPEFEQRVGWVAPIDVPIILVTNNDAEAQKAIRLMAFLGLDGRVAGHLVGGFDGWINAGRAHSTIPQLSVHQLEAHLLNGINMQVLDVRETSEWAAGHINGAHYMNYKYMTQQIGTLSLQTEQHISVMCARGMRSSTACSILKMSGYEHIYNVTGGMSAWNAAGLPTVM
ncbi:MAG: rhodanese-like domain-containing protein [Chloroflexota bacterium]